jgi:hypothetical protein
LRSNHSSATLIRRLPEPLEAEPRVACGRPRGYASGVTRLAPAIAVLMLACGADDAPPPDAVYIRLRNDTELDFTRLSLAFRLGFDAVPAGTTSEYRPEAPGVVYSVEGGTAETNELRFHGTVFDHLGDETLGNGYYTFDIFAAIGSSSYPGEDGWVSFTARP